MHDDDPLLARAFGYPYPLPKKSYVLLGEEVANVENDGDLPPLGGRKPVLAVGSNQAPAQLIRKFGDEDWGPIPVTRIHLRDFDTVFSPHIAAYGSVAATLQVSVGTTVSLFVTWLDERQLLRMHETEVAAENYHFAHLDQINARVDVGPTLSSVYFYVSRHGTLNADGAPVPLAEVPALNRRFAPKSQSDVQTLVRDRLAPGEELSTFIRSSVADVTLRRARTAKLREGAHPFRHEGMTVLTRAG